MLTKVKSITTILSFVISIYRPCSALISIPIEGGVKNVEAENKNDDIEMIAKLVQSEAGNQDLTGKRYVVDVVLNRVDSDEFPNSVEEVIFQDNQFSVIKNGAFEKASWTVTEECYEAVLLEYEERLNADILYFSRGKSPYASDHFKYQDHWFGW